MLQVPLKMLNKKRSFWVQRINLNDFSLKLKNIYFFNSRFIFYFFSKCSSSQHCFDVAQRWENGCRKWNVVSAFFKVVNSSDDVNWCCATSWRHINLKTNVCSFKQLLLIVIFTIRSKQMVRKCLHQDMNFSVERSEAVYIYCHVTMNKVLT